MSSFSPPGQTAEVHARSALVLAPHYDDEVLGCGGLVAQLSAGGAAVRVLFLSDGGAVAGEGEERRQYVERRRAEARQATAVLGIAGFDELLLPDGALEQHFEALQDGIRRALLSLRPELLLVTSPLEVSSDHRAAFAAVHRLVGEARSPDPLAAAVSAIRVLAYEVNQPLYPDLLVDVGDQVPQIEQAMACYASQQERHDYLGARLGLLRFRGLSLAPGHPAVEAYRQLSAADFETSSPARLVAELGGAAAYSKIDHGPRVSVIVRTRDRPDLLAEALASLAASTYHRLEVVVVNDAGRPPALPEDYPLELRLVDLTEHGGRAVAANAGIEAASGEYVAFLDDDDLVDPEHFAVLVGLVAGAGVRVAYTDAAVGVYELSSEPAAGTGWIRREKRLPYSRDFDGDLLLFDNFIPFNTLLIDRQLLTEVGPVDESLPFFEDWDLLIRLAERTVFHHCPRVTCEYRHFRGSGHHILADQPRQRADFLEVKARVLDKHATRRDALVTARVVDRLRAEAVAESELAKELADQLRLTTVRAEEQQGKAAHLEIHTQSLVAETGTLKKELRAHERELHRRDREIRARDQEIRDRDREIRSRERRLADFQAKIDEQGEHLGRTYAEIERLGGILETMRASRAWRIHEWWQRRKR